MKFISVHRLNGIYVHVKSLQMFELSASMQAAEADEYMRLGAVSKQANEETGKISLQVTKVSCSRKRHQTGHWVC